MDTSIDVRVSNHGTLYGFRPVSDAAKQWFEDSVSSESWQWMGGTLYVDHRYARNLGEGLQAEGFTLA